MATPSSVPVAINDSEAVVLPSITSSLSVFKSQILTKYRSGESGDRAPGLSVGLPKIFNKSTVCSYCSASLKGCAYIKIVPQKVLGKKIKRIVRKSTVTGIDTFSKYELGLWKKYQKNVGNTLGLTCQCCEKKTIIPMTKPAVSKIPNEERKEIVQQTIKKKKNKKKQKKDNLAGLKLSSARISNPTILYPDSKSKTKVNSDRGTQKIQINKKGNHTHVTMKESPVMSSSHSKPLQQYQTGKLGVRKAHIHHTLPEKNKNVSGCFKTIKKNNKLAELVAQSNEAKKVAAKSKSMGLLGTLQLLLKEK